MIFGAYSLLRGIFFFWNHSLFADVSASQVAKAFLAGVRFDLVAIFVINSPVIALTMLPWQSHPPRNYQRTIKFLFLALNFPFLVINLVDIEYIQFTGRRSDPNGAATNASGRCGVCWVRAHPCRMMFWMTSTGRKRNRNVARCALSEFFTPDNHEDEEAH